MSAHSEETEGDTDLEWDPPSHDDTVLGTFEQMMRWGDDWANENQFDDAIRIYESARRTLADDDQHKQLVDAKLSAIRLRCGDTHRADLHMTKASPVCKEDLRAKIAQVKDHLIRGGEAREHDDWIAALKEVEAMIAAGADSSQPAPKAAEQTPATPTAASGDAKEGPSVHESSTDKNHNYGVLAGTVAFASAIAWYLLSKPKKSEDKVSD